MKCELTDSILTGALGALLILCVFLCERWGVATHEARQLMFRGRQLQAEQVRLQGLLFECQNYGATNSAIDPILETVGVKSAKSLLNTAKPATK